MGHNALVRRRQALEFGEGSSNTGKMDLEQQIQELEEQADYKREVRHNKYIASLAKKAATKYTVSQVKYNAWPKLFAQVYAVETDDLVNPEIAVSKKFLKEYDAQRLEEPEIVQALAQTYINQKRYDKALEMMKYATHNNITTFPTLANELAHVFVKKQKAHKARQAYNIANNQQTSLDVI